MWRKADDLPVESGYYFTIYFNEERQQLMYKAFWFDIKDSKWIFRFTPNVKAWWNVRHDYYIPCQYEMKVDQNPPQEWL